MKDSATSAWQSLRPDIERLFRLQWNDPELPAMEYRSSERLAGWLEYHGFAVTRRAGGLPTAFVAIKGSSGPAIGILAEYDALPGLGNAAVGERRATDSAAGHACGHNHIGPANAGAAIAAAAALRERGVEARICVFGCPAEELLWGKIALWRAGVFDGVDVLLTSHGDYQNGSLARPCQAVSSGEFAFQGRAGHGGKASAANALLAAEQAVALAGNALECCPGILFRHALRHAGAMPSITPSDTRLWVNVRGYDMEAVRRAYDAVAGAAEEAASLAGLAVRHQFIAESRGYLPNDAIGRALFDAVREVGPPAWSEDDLSFMRALSDAVAPGTPMTLDRGLRYFADGQDYYGQDDGELSWHIPLGRLNWAYPEQVPIHHWAWTALSGHSASHAGPLMASQALARAITRIATDRALVEKAQAELRERTAGQTLGQPRLGALRALTENPQSFWDASWVA